MYSWNDDSILPWNDNECAIFLWNDYSILPWNDTECKEQSFYIVELIYFSESLERKILFFWPLGLLKYNTTEQIIELLLLTIFYFYGVLCNYGLKKTGSFDGQFW